MSSFVLRKVSGVFTACLAPLASARSFTVGSSSPFPALPSMLLAVVVILLAFVVLVVHPTAAHAFALATVPVVPVAFPQVKGDGVTLTDATAHWSTRPADQRFGSLADLRAQADARKAAATTHRADMKDLRVIVGHSELPDANGDMVTTPEPHLVGEQGQPFRMTHAAFGNLAQRVGAPAAYLRTLPAHLAAECINDGLAGGRMPVPVAGDDDESEPSKVKLLVQGLHKTAAPLVRAITSPKYGRLWNADIVARLQELEIKGWKLAPAAFDGSRGLYDSPDGDMFAFMVDNDRRIFETAPGGGLGRGFFVGNIETYGKSFFVKTFLYEFVCGNHRVWGATDVKEVRIRHIGSKVDGRAWDQFAVTLRQYANASAADLEARIDKARRYVIGATRDEILDTVFGLRQPLLTRKLIGQAFDVATAEEAKYGNPRSAWGLSGGMTQVARDMSHASDRVALEQAAGKVLELAGA